jgi:hypothetical protein
VASVAHWLFTKGCTTDSEHQKNELGVIGIDIEINELFDKERQFINVITLFSEENSDDKPWLLLTSPPTVEASTFSRFPHLSFSLSPNQERESKQSPHTIQLPQSSPLSLP